MMKGSRYSYIICIIRWSTNFTLSEGDLAIFMKCKYPLQLRNFSKNVSKRNIGTGWHTPRKAPYLPAFKAHQSQRDDQYDRPQENRSPGPCSGDMGPFVQTAGVLKASLPIWHECIEMAGHALGLERETPFSASAKDKREAEEET